MGTQRKAYIEELKRYDNPSNPETSAFDLVLPATTIQAVREGETGKGLNELLGEKLDKSALGSSEAGSAVKLKTARTFQVSGGATAAAKSFNGTANVNLEVTALDVSKATAGTLPTARGGTGNINGTVAKLTNARTVQTDLASTATASFDGTANITPGVKGVLPAANGGTGNANGTVARLTTARTVQTDLASTATASFNGSANITPGVKGILPVANGGTGNANGTVAKLTTSRTLRTNLASTTAANFDGSANVTPGVTGTLPVANGGTGLATIPSGSVIVGNGTGIPTTRAIATAPASGSTALLTAGGAYTALANKANLGLPTKIPIVFASGVQNISGWQSYYTKDDLGRVQLVIHAYKPDGFTHAAQIATLPAGYIPAVTDYGYSLCGTIEFDGRINRPVCNISIGYKGELKLYSATDTLTGAIYFHCNISYLATGS